MQADLVSLEKAAAVSAEKTVEADFEHLEVHVQKGEKAVKL